MNGILLIDKPEGWTSHDVAAKLRGICRERRIGHSGTLDPLATGLLCAFIGRATRAVEFAEAHDKEYIAGLRLGFVSDTYDITGNVTQIGAPRVSATELENALRAFRGDILQTPPMYSAIKTGGKKLYELARAGIEVERKPRAVTISELAVIGESDGDYIVKIHCTKGTYIRSLCHDIGEMLGCGGVMSSLRRTAVGSFKVEDAQTLDEIEDAAGRGEADSRLLTVDSIFGGHAEFAATSAHELKIRNGAMFPVTVSDGLYRVYGESGEFLMLGSVLGGMMSSAKNFF